METIVKSITLINDFVCLNLTQNIYRKLNCFNNGDYI